MFKIREQYLMKKLLLPVYKKKNQPKSSHPYYILFDIGQRLEFKSKRKAEDYVRKISSYATDSIRVINTIQKELYSVYMEQYFKMTEFHCNKVRRSMNDYLEDLGRFHGYQSRGDACIKFISVYSLLNQTEDTCKLLRVAMKGLKDYNTVSRLNGYLQMLTSIYENLSNLKKGDLSTVYKKSSLKLIYKKEATVTMI